MRIYAHIWIVDATEYQLARLPSSGPQQLGTASVGTGCAPPPTPRQSVMGLERGLPYLDVTVRAGSDKLLRAQVAGRLDRAVVHARLLDLWVTGQGSVRLLDLWVTDRGPVRLLDLRVLDEGLVRLLDLWVTDQGPVRLLDLWVTDQGPVRLLDLRVTDQGPVRLLDLRVTD